jgi:hypothetical protein
MATAATSSGASASNEPNTNTSTASAPTAPIRVRFTTSAPGDSLPWLLSWSIPVTLTVEPGGSAATARVGSSPCSPPNTSAYVVRRSAETKRRSPAAYDATRASGSRANDSNARRR